jgi:hypothetical protein
MLCFAQVYIGSFNSDAPINVAKNPHCVELFKAEQEQLLSDLYEIPSRSCDRKVRAAVRCLLGACLLLVCGQVVFGSKVHVQNRHSVSQPTYNTLLPRRDG